MFLWELGGKEAFQQVTDIMNGYQEGYQNMDNRDGYSVGHLHSVFHTMGVVKHPLDLHKMAI